MDNTSNGNNKLEFKTDRQTLVSPDINNLQIERKETKVVNNPLAPGHLGGPVIVTDESGNRIGNVWKASEDSELGQALKNVESGSATSVYFDLRTGKFSNHPASSMTYKDGKIILNVADDVANADWYKNIFGGDNFKTLAEMYALDPTGKTELEIEKDGNKEKKTINDMLREYAETLADNSKKYQGNIDTRELFRRATDGALILSDDDLALMSNYQEVKKDHYSDSDVVVLPEFAKEYFKGYESYNAETGSVSAKDFFTEFYHLDKEAPDSLKAIIEELGNGVLGDDSEARQNVLESEKDYAIDLLRLGSEREMNSIVSRMMMSDLVEKNDPSIQKMRERMSIRGALTEEEKAELTTEFVKCYSLYQMMVQDTPDSGSATGFNLAIQNLAIGFGDSFITNTERALVGGSYFTWGMGATVGGAVASIDGLFGFLGGLIRNFLEGGIDKVNENFDYISNSWSRSMEEVFGEGSFLDEWKDSIDSIVQAMENRTDLAGTLLPDDFYKDMAQTYATAATMQRIGAIAGYALNQILITNPIGSAVGSAVTRYVGDAVSLLVTGETMFNTLHNMATVYGYLGATANTVKMATDSLRVLNQIQRVSSIAGFSANILAQGVVDTFLENPTLTDAVIFGNTDKNTANFQEELRNNIVANLVGETIPFAGKGLKKATSKFASTKVGSVLQGVARKQVNWFTIKGRKLYQGISELMTKKSKTELVEDLGVDAPWAKKINPEKRMQALRKEIIEIQEQIKDTKIFRGDGSWSESAAKIDELVQARIDLEEALGVAKKIQIAETKEKIVRNAGLQYDAESLSVNTAKLSTLSRKMKQTNLPGSFSIETGDYINDLYNKMVLDSKIESLGKAGKSLSKKEMASYNVLKERIVNYENSLPAEYASEYKALAKDYVDANIRYYWKLNNFLASDAGGNLIPLNELQKMRASGVPYMRLSAQGDIDDVSRMLFDPNYVVEQGKVGAGVERFNRQMFDDKTVYRDPNYVRDLYVGSYARATNGANMNDAIVRAGRATSVPTDSKGNILKTPEAVAEAKRELYKSIDDAYEDAFKQSAKLNDLGDETIKSKQKSPEKYWKTAQSQAKRTINKILGLDKRGLRRYASTLNSDEIANIGKVYDLPNYSEKVTTIKQLKALYGSLSDTQKKIVDKAIPGFSKTDISKISKDAIDSWNYAVKNNNLDNLLSRQYIKDSDSILDSEYYKDMVGAKRATSLGSDEVLALREAKINLEEAESNIPTGEVAPEELKKFNATAKRRFDRVVKNTISDAVEMTAERLMDNPYLEQLIKEYEKIGVSSDSAKQYLIYQWMYDNASNNKMLQEIAFRFYNAPSKVSELKISTDAAQKFAKKFDKASKSIIESKLNKTIAKVQEEGVEGLIDMEATMKRVEAYFKDITDLWGAKRIVEAWDREKGQFKYYQVDNSTYNLVTNYPSFKKNNLFARTMARINSLARIGQITLRTASLVTQGFKDTFNAMVLGGWEELWLDNPNTYKKIAEYIGPDVVEAFRKEMSPSAWKDFLATADWEGLSVEEAIAKAEINNDWLNLKIKGPGTSTQYFSSRNLREGMTVAEQSVADTWAKNKKRWTDAYRKASDALGKVNDSVNILHNARENFLRKQVYRQNFAEALDAGKSLTQARNYASYFMENATTNFSRGFAWGSNIVRSIPYFGAMLNGASSMIRLLEVDPVGIMMRFTTDLVIPTVGLTVMSLQDPYDAEVYKNIPEYEKRDSLHWVMNGEVFTIPLPEELAKFILPIRHAVEKMHDGNDLAWNDLLVNDILNLPTIRLSGIAALDQKKLGADPSVADRLSNVGMDLFNTLSPNGARTMYIAITGKDPYTHQNYGKMRWYVNENGEYELMAVSEYDFCNDLAELFKSWGWNVSPVMAEGILGSMFGTGSMDITEGVRDFASLAQQGKFDPSALVSPSFERAGNVLTGTTRTNEKQAQIAWYNVYNELKAEKLALLAPDGKLAKYSQDIDTAKTADKQAKATEFYNAEVRNWQQKVIDTVKQYTANFGDFYDRSKFAATLSTMTVDLSINNRKDSTDYNNARSLAVETMLDAGFDSPNDNSIFGYVTTNQVTGAAEIHYYDPLVVSMMSNLSYGQADDAKEMMEDTLEYSGLKTKYKEVVYPAYSKYMDAGNYTEANKLAANWDVEVMQALKPIIDDYTVGDLLNSSVVIDLLDNYILIPNTTEAIGKGKYYSSKTGLNKRRGFTQSYAKKIYNAMKESK